MNKKVIVIIICVKLGLVLGVVLSVNNESNDREDLESYSKIYDENGNVINGDLLYRLTRCYLGSPMVSVSHWRGQDSGTVHRAGCTSHPDLVLKT